MFKHCEQFSVCLLCNRILGMFQSQFLEREKRHVELFCFRRMRFSIRILRVICFARPGNVTLQEVLALEGYQLVN